MTRKLKSGLVLAVVVLTATTAVYFFSSRPSPLGLQAAAGDALSSTASAQRVLIKWGGPRNISMVPLIAEHLDLFAKEGASAKYVEIQTGKRAMDAIRTGDIDLGVLVDVNIAFAGFEQADDLRVLALQ